MTFAVQTPHDFNFWSTVYSHGWCALPPFRIDKERKRVSLIVPGENGEYDVATLRPNRTSISVDLEDKSGIPAEQKKHVSSVVRSIFRMDEPLEEFYHEAKKYPRYRWVVKRGAGRLLRCPTVFEDVVKMICTTNCSWALTETMIKALTAKLGVRVRDDAYAFPTPEKIAGQTEKFLRKEIRCGYRAPYLLELSTRVAAGQLSLEHWRSSSATTEELFEEVRSVKGAGDYTAGNILKLLGRYDYLGLDSWCRGKFYAMYKNGRKVKDSTIERHYRQFGKWQGLFLWMDLTKEWYDKKFPF